MQDATQKNSIWKVISASSAGTLIEWYDFYIFASLSVTLAPAFFPKTNPTAGLLSTLALLATGFVVRPFGAVFFGRIGDIVGRKYTFLLTLILMGGSTFAIGLMPTYSQIGIVAPFLLLILRLLQGLALGGEYGGAATYVAEHAPDGRRGFFTSFIQTTATLGLFVSLAVVLTVNSLLTPAQFDDWGWRIPFLLSIILVVFSYAIRRKMAESPMFARLKEEGKLSKNPLRESFVNPANRRLVLIALFGLTAGQGVVWYTGQFYALLYMQTVLNIDKTTASITVAIALLAGTPLFIYFGSRSDKVGRKKIILAGCVLAAVLYVPIYSGMIMATKVSGFSNPVAVVAPKPSSKRDLKTGDTVLTSVSKTQYDEGLVTITETDTYPANPAAQRPPKQTKTEIKPASRLVLMLSALVFIQVIFVTMVYGPIAAFLVEMFPTKIRYTSMSVPYHIGNGVFGGLIPIVCVALNKAYGPYAGLAYPIGIALLTAVIGGLFIKDRFNVKLWDEDETVMANS